MSTNQVEIPKKPNWIVTNLLGVVLTILMTIGVQFILGLFSRDNGAVRISPVTKVKDNSFVTVDIDNFSRNIQEGLIFSMPTSINLTEADSTPASLKLERVPDSAGTNQSMRISVSGMPPETVTRLILPFSSPTNTIGAVSLLNGHEKKFSLERGGDKIMTIFYQAIINGTLIGIIMLYGVHLSERRREVLVEKMRQQNTAIDTLQSQIDKGDQRADKIYESFKLDVNTARKTKLILHARVADMTREIRFWRDTIRKVLYSESRKNKDSEALIAEIQSSLRTFKVLEPDPDFEEIRTYAEILKSNDETKSIKKESKRDGKSDPSTA